MCQRTWLQAGWQLGGRATTTTPSPPAPAPHAAPSALNEKDVREVEAAAPVLVRGGIPHRPGRGARSILVARRAIVGDQESLVEGGHWSVLLRFILFHFPQLAQVDFKNIGIWFLRL